MICIVKQLLYRFSCANVFLAAVTFQLIGAASAEAERICREDQRLIESREGKVVYDGSDVWLQSKSWGNRDGTFWYDYCVKNTHSYTPLYVEWQGRKKFISNTARALPQGKVLVRSFNQTSRTATPENTDFRYGSTISGQVTEQVETVFEMARSSREIVFPCSS